MNTESALTALFCMSVSALSLLAAIIRPASKHLNNVILSSAKNLVFSFRYEILHFVQDDHYCCRVNNLLMPRVDRLNYGSATFGRGRFL